MTATEQLGARAKASSISLAQLPEGEKNRALAAIALGLSQNIEAILRANELDLEEAGQNGMSTAMQDRLRLTPQRMEGIVAAIHEVSALPEPVGRVLDGQNRPNGLQIFRVTVPFGVVGIIYEARPNVTVDTAVLCLKSGNTCILRGGREAFHSNKALVDSMRHSLEEAGFDPDYILLIEDTSRQSAAELMTLTAYLDLLVPRGGAGLIRSVVENARVPVIETGLGNCHIYIDKDADLEMAASITDNAKTSRPSVCNACETVLCHEAVAAEFLPMMKQRLDAHNVDLRGCPQTRAILGASVLEATEEDFATEYDDYILAIRVVPDIEEALRHIERYSTRHSEAIITESLKASRLFTSRVDSAAVYVNASTRFTDGGEFGLGAELGISTQKLHARGPMGLTHLTSYKYIITGNGQIR
ncbi:glutamate-5-semialdehyde dehydrogenase [Oscillospiraceae bacterium MB08-C2-2]|nr:glutamate-5-semialdehyde dehydrogenase [Oscillospiraceae bacterium MB08-C2-2]